ncbi:MAG: prepilin-type N-terminal cleavage/methylation domain-containing protein [Thermoguttaceae bacterium]|nr:prepilin-type N-terminal cleavage/methylation domain-containing protein [Thermoguttaceae bacterium]
MTGAKVSFRTWSASSLRRGFTLTELLLVIIIIAILAAMTMTVQRSAVESTRRERTIATIRKIDAALTSAYEKYQYRKPDVDFFINRTEKGLIQNFADRGRDFRALSEEQQKRWIMGSIIQEISGIDSPWARFLDRENFEPDIDHQFAPYVLRTVILRELLMIDFPDCLDEVRYDPVINDTENSPVHIVYHSRRRELETAAGSAPDGDISADLLYLIVMNTSPETRGSFLDRETADTNGNGIPEFIDGWGNPIRFIRWAPALPESNRQPTLGEGARISRYRQLRRRDLAGYELDASNGADYAGDLFYSEAADSYPASDYDFYTYFDEYYPGLLENSADPFDPMGSMDGMLLAPLVYSAGPDREYGMFPKCRPYDENGNDTEWNADNFQRTVSPETGLDIWGPMYGIGSQKEAASNYIGLGDWYGDAEGNTYSRDNITNHNLE